MLATSAYASYSGCRQYRENLADALAALEAEGLEAAADFSRGTTSTTPVRRGHDRRGVRSLAELPEEIRAGARIAFTHAIRPDGRRRRLRPRRGARRRRRVRQAALDVARLIVDAVRAGTGVEHPWQLVYQSPAGAPHIPWLEPDICDHLEARHAEGVPAVVIVPIGFVSDHMEVLYDLDTEATAKAEELGLPVRRSATVGADPSFAAAVRELVVERAAGERGQDVAPCALGALGPTHDLCPVGCCPARAPRPAAAGADSTYA
ncbi:Coproporphyrin III ferrochelatase OS=Streptomyces griseomycini OX=66895 GN=cpfC PE=3 SV=1 [Streptomyces griseomycini]